MRHQYRWAAIAAFVLAPLQAHAQSQAVQFTGGTPGGNADQGVGWQFNVVNGIIVDGLSWFDNNGDGLSIGRMVGLWSPTGVLLASVMIPGGTAAPLVQGWRTVTIPDLFLAVASGYIVGGQNYAASTDGIEYNVTQTVNPNLTFVNATYGEFVTTLQRPTAISIADNGFYGPGFTIANTTSTPEPETYMLVASGLAGLLVTRRRVRR
jgi:hypothetical protein